MGQACSVPEMAQGCFFLVGCCKALGEIDIYVCKYGRICLCSFTHTPNHTHPHKNLSPPSLSPQNKPQQHNTTNQNLRAGLQRQAEETVLQRAEPPVLAPAPFREDGDGDALLCVGLVVVFWVVVVVGGGGMDGCMGLDLGGWCVGLLLLLVVIWMGVWCARGGDRFVVRTWR